MEMAHGSMLLPTSEKRRFSLPSLSVAVWGAQILPKWKVDATHTTRGGGTSTPGGRKHVCIVLTCSVDTAEEANYCILNGGTRKVAQDIQALIPGKLHECVVGQVLDVERGIVNGWNPF